MWFQILGPVRIRTDTGEARIIAERERALLAVLLLRANRVVTWAELVAAVWGDRPLRNARTQLQGCVSRLRRQLSEAGVTAPVIHTDQGGYQARVPPESLDLLEFRRLRDAGRVATRDDRAAEASRHYRAALALWRGVPLADVHGDHRVRLAAADLAEERVQTLEECVQAELAGGKAGELVSELTELVRDHPYRETLRGALMLALYRAGRQADALAAYQQVQRLLRDELGTEPSTELQQLHRAILNHDHQLQPPAAAAQLAAQAPASASASASGTASAPVPRELPGDVPAFTGRAELLAALDKLVPDVTAGSAVPVVVSAVAGTAGVGKTALVIHWAHRVADQFPGGQLYVDLRGHAPGPPLRPLEALAAMLRSLGTPADQIPAEQAQAAAMYRSALAGRRALVVLDNAASVAQVRPLLPGTSGCLALVTSRQQLTGLVARDGARRLALDVLTTDEAAELLARLLGAERVAAEPEAAAALAQACAYLPLALRIAAAHVDERPGRSIAGFVAELTSGGRLSALRTDDDEESSVAIALSRSYRDLPEAAATLFRRLGLVPGPDFTAEAAAALMHHSVTDATPLLRRLASGHLIEEHRSGRFRFHDLLRSYAAQLVATDEPREQGAAARRRLLGYYLSAVDAAAGVLFQSMPRLPVPAADHPLPPVGFEGQGDAMAWLDIERANLVAAVTDAARHGPPPVAWLIADAMRGYLMRRQSTVEWQTIAEAALTAAQRAGDVTAQSSAWHSLSKLHGRLGRYTEAVEGLDTALDLARRAGWSAGQTVMLRSRSVVLTAAGRLGPAAESLSDALELERRAGNLDGQAAALTGMGIINRERGRLHEAADYFAQAFAIDRQLGTPDGQATSYHNLATIHRDLGRLHLAAEHLAEALALHRQVGDLPGVAIGLIELAGIDRDAGRLTEALQNAQESLSLARDTGSRRVEIDALNALGSAFLAQDYAEQALEHHTEALSQAVRMGARYPETHARLGLAGAHHRLGHHRDAADCARAALELASTVGYGMLAGQALTTLAETAAGRGSYHEAAERAGQALANHRETGHRLGEARALTLLGHISQATGDPMAARQHWRAATDLYTDIGAPVPTEP